MVFTVPESVVRFVLVVARLVFVVARFPERVAIDPVIVEREPERAFCARRSV